VTDAESTAGQPVETDWSAQDLAGAVAAYAHRGCRSAVAPDIPFGADPELAPQRPMPL